MESEHSWDYWRRRVASHKGVSFRAGIFIWVDDKMLLVRGNDLYKRRRMVRGRWGPPKGCVAPGEKYVWETALREVREETGIREITREMLSDELYLYVRHREGTITSLYLHYVVRLMRRPVVRISRDEIAEYGWFDRDHIPADATVVMKYYCGKEIDHGKEIVHGKEVDHGKEMDRCKEIIVG